MLVTEETEDMVVEVQTDYQVPTTTFILLAEVVDIPEVVLAELTTTTAAVVVVLTTLEPTKVIPLVFSRAMAKSKSPIKRFKYNKVLIYIIIMELRIYKMCK